jgi:hypothetical protein
VDVTGASGKISVTQIVRPEMVQLTKVLHEIKYCRHTPDCCCNARFGESILDVSLDRSPSCSSELVYCLRIE